MIRLKIKTKIKYNYPIPIEKHQEHYLFNVMRRERNDCINVFNDLEEWVVLIDKKFLIPQSLYRVNTNITTKSIALSCIKPARLEIALEKLTEIGIDNIYLLNTERSFRGAYNYIRFEKIISEAVEQSNRFTTPKIHSPQSLKDFLNGFSDKNLALMSCLGGEISSKQDFLPIIGPEGGFSELENNLMSDIMSFSLEPNTLRAETAAIIASGFIK